MPGTLTRYNVAAIPAGVVANVWVGVALPAADARITLHTDGTPESVANPSAKHLGHTDAGVTVSATASPLEFQVDELPYPFRTVPDTVSVSVSGTLTQINDEEVMKVLAGDIGTYSTAAGYKQFQLGFKSTIPLTTLAIIYATPMDPTKFGVFNLYSMSNTAGFTFTLGRKTRAGTPFTFTAQGVSGRANTDSLGNLWWQI